MTDRHLTCAELDERLGDYLEGSLDDASVADIELHLSGCPACAALVRDFERIARDAASLPAMAPTRDLWPDIALRLDTPVADLASHAAAKRATGVESAGHARHGAPRAPSAWHRVRLGAIAAGLVGLTAISTWYLTSRTPSSDLATTELPSADRAPSTAGRVAAVTDSPALAPSTAGPESPAMPAAPPSASGVTPVNRAARPAPLELFDTEISSLRGVLSQRREELDPRTVAILESSIATIDSAIADARRALEVDPASRFLSTQLNKALEKKLGLLRTAALLPSRT